MVSPLSFLVLVICLFSWSVWLEVHKFYSTHLYLFKFLNPKASSLDSNYFISPILFARLKSLTSLRLLSLSSSFLPYYPEQLIFHLSEFCPKSLLFHLKTSSSTRQPPLFS